MKKLLTTIVALALVATWSIQTVSSDGPALPDWFAAVPSARGGERPRQAGSGEKITATPEPKSGTLLTMEDGGEQIKVRDGQVITISLEANPATGYLWEVEEIDEKRVQSIGPIAFEGAASDRMGAPVKQIMRFTAVEKGTSSLSLAYRRSWETGEAIKTFSIEVDGVGEFTEDVRPPSFPSAAPESSPSEDEQEDSLSEQQVSGVPSSFNWCDQGGCTPVKDQSSCGSCWAFATAGVVESAIKIEDGVTRDLAEQYLVSCNTDGWSCNGGWWAFDYFEFKKPPGESAAGVVYEGNFPYSATDEACSPPHTHHEKIDSSPSSVSDIKQAIHDHGPIVTAVCVGPAFQSYSGGVFEVEESYQCNGGINHGVVLVGWDDNQGTSGVWYMKNSWGTGWGESGYMRIGYGISNIGSHPEYVTYGSDGGSDADLAYDSHWVDDDDSDQSDGDGDNVLDCGETIELYVDLTNQGSDTAAGVEATISTSDSYVTSWPYNTESDYPDLAGGGSGTNYNDFDLTVASDTPNGHDITFDLDISDGNGNSWSDSFDVTVSCQNNPPNQPSNPTPSDGASGQFIDTVTLSWSGGDPDGDAVTYDVYFEAGDSSPDTLICNDVASTSCDPGTLAYDTTYYWYVVASDGQGNPSTGSTWDFTTKSSPSVGPLVYNDHAIDDNNYGQSSGNDDGMVDAGEAIELDVELYNQGSDAASGVDVDISTADSYVTWLYNTSSAYPSISGGGTGTNSDDFDFQVASNTPDGHVITFDLSITGDNGSWSDSFDVTVNNSAADVDLVYDSYTVDDDASSQSQGDDDGVVDCGETIELFVDLLNQGSDTATGVSASIGCTDSYVTDWLYNVESSYPDIAGSGTGTNQDDFDFTVDSATPDGHTLTFTLNISDAVGNTWSDSFSIPVSCSGSNQPPHQPHTPTPADGDSGQATDTTTLSWRGGDPDGDAVTYDVYFEADDSSPDTLLCDDAGSTSCDPGTLDYDTRYYWYVEASDGQDTAQGGIWDFTTEAQGTTGPLVYSDHTIDDDNVDESRGNDDGVVNAGEIIELGLELENRGTSAATNVDLTISTTDPYVTWLYNTDSDYPDIAGGGVGTNQNDFDFDVSANTPNSHTVTFDLAITSDQGSWSDAFNVQVTADTGPGPALGIPQNIRGYAGQTVEVPVNFLGRGNDVASSDFSIDYDEAYLSFDDSDDDLDGTPDAISFDLPSAFEGSVTFESSDADGELDFRVADTISPLASLSDGTVVSITFDVLEVGVSTPTVAAVNFSSDPSATFGDTSGESIAGVTSDGSVEVMGGKLGDCNGNQIVGTGDFTALAAEIFDGDGSAPSDTPGGLYAGSPIGCNPNQDNAVDAGDFPALAIIIFGSGGQRSAREEKGLTSQAATLSMSRQGTVGTIKLAPNNNVVGSAIFSVNYDDSALTFDASDDDGDGVPDAISTAALGDQYRVYALALTPPVGSRINFFILDTVPPITPLPEGSLVSITFGKKSGQEGMTELPVTFAQTPLPSLGSVSGESIPTLVVDYSVYLPLVVRNQ